MAFKVKRTKFQVGDRVSVQQGSGLSSGKQGEVVPKYFVKTDGSGIPTNIDGAYKQVDWKKEVPVLYDNGKIDTISKKRLEHIYKGRRY